MLVTTGDLSFANSVGYHFKQDSVSHSELKREQFTLWDISVDYQLNNKQSIELAINNISNQTYYGSFDEDAALQPKRSIRLASRWRF